MVETITKPEGKDWKKFLKSQVYTMSEKIWRALSRYDEEKDDAEEVNKKKPTTEKDVIKDILEERSDLFARRAIVWDIISYSTKIWWEEKQITKFKCKYWLWITIDNLNSFLDFCAIHGFIPMVDKIYIWWHDVSQIKELYTFFAFSITKPLNPLIINSLGNEIKKLDKIFQWPSRDVLDYLQRIIDHNTKTYQYLLWEKLQKLKNKWALSENIFAEVALRLENQIREKIWIESSYLKLAWYRDDMENKTDMNFIIKKTPSQSYQVIPMQFTTSWPLWVIKNKEKAIEAYIFKSLNEKAKIWNFLIFAVNGEFSEHIAHGDNLNKEEESEEYMILNKEYSDWIENPMEREKNVGSKFPLFIDSIDPKIIQPAEVMYIALHMLYKKYNFRYTMKESYKKAFHKLGKIDKTNHSEINNVRLSDIKIEDFSKNEGAIKIDWCSIEKIDNPRPDFPSLLKHRFLISYQWKHMWTIVIYEVEQKAPQKK